MKDQEIWYYRPSAFFRHPLSLIGKVQKHGLLATFRVADVRPKEWAKMAVSGLALPRKLSAFQASDPDSVLRCAFANKAIEPLQVHPIMVSYKQITTAIR